MRRQRASHLLHASACHQVAEVDREEGGGREPLDDRGLGRGIVAGEEDTRRQPASWGSASKTSLRGVGGVNKPGARDEVGDDLLEVRPRRGAFHAFVASMTA